MSIGDLAHASGLIDELKEFHRTGQWERAVDRYQPLRRLLIESRSRYSHVARDERQIFQTAISEVSLMETQAGAAIADNSKPDANRFNRILIGIQALLDEARVGVEQGTAGGG